MTDFLPYAAMIALVFSFTNFLKAVRNKDVNASFTQLIVWAAGIAAVVLFAHSDWASAIPVGNFNLSDVNTASLIIIGLTVGSGATTAYDFKKAIDNTDTAADPPLVK
jgi:uncharacterized membrane protein